MLKFNLSKIFVSCCIFVFSMNVWANDKILHVTVKLLKIQAMKNVEKSGDEVYFSISEYMVKKEPILTRVPIFPLYWKSKDLSMIQDVVLWSGDIKIDHSASVVLTVMEQDLPPFNPDDLIGSVQVKLKNNKGKIASEWSIPKYRDQPKIEQPDSKVPKFFMYGDGSKYAVVFSVEATSK